MKYAILMSFVLLFNTMCFAQSMSAKQLLDKAIAFHDPDSAWSSFNGDLNIVMTMPDGSKRISDININLPSEYFSVSATADQKTTFYEISKGQCQMQFNGKVVDDKTAKDNNLSCDRALLYKNYYTYLYGLPMKLRDPGTNIKYPVEKKTFKGKEYLVLKAT